MKDQSGMTAMADLPVPWRRRMIIAGGGALAAAHLPLLFHEAGNQRLPHLENLLFEPTAAALHLVLICWA